MKNIKDMWNEMYRDESALGCGPDDWLVDVLERRKPGRALEFAAGAGANALWLASKGWSVTATDYAERAITHLQGQLEGSSLDVRAKVADALTYDGDTAQYDLVYMCYLHLPESERRRMLENAARHLKKGGRLIYIGIVAPEGLPDGIDPAWFADLPAVEASLPPSLEACARQGARRFVPVSTEEGFEQNAIYLEAEKVWSMAQG